MIIQCLDSVGMTMEFVEDWDSIMTIVNLQVINTCIVPQFATYNAIKN